MISSITVILLQLSIPLALTQTPSSHSQILENYTNEQNAYATRVHKFSPTQSSRAMLTTGELQPSSLRHMHRTTTVTPHQQQFQPKSLKFTLTAGKYWKFNIKTNSLFSSHIEKELRLHKNVSVGNYIIDDDGWFQYNHAQQQLFAWPSFSVKSGTYYFVLLPSGLDYEADGENVVNIGDVAANIIVELIRPYFSGVVNTKLELDHLIDYEFSLDYLHRHSSYPLLLTQIVSVFDLLSKSSTSTSSGNVDQNSSLPPHSTMSTTVRSLTTASMPSSLSQTMGATPQQNKQARLASKFNEFLLIDSSGTHDGEFFSLTWTTHPSPTSNAISPINECRLSIINDTISRLSSRSILYPVFDDKFVISYALEGPLVDSRAIIPTERGNYALKLSLHNACKNKRVIDELGVTSIKGFPMSVDDKDSTASTDNASLQSSSTESINTGLELETAPSELADKQRTNEEQEHIVEPIQAITDSPPLTTTGAHIRTSLTLGSSPYPLEPNGPNLKSLDDSTQIRRTVPTTTTVAGPISASPTAQLENGWSQPPESQPTPDPISRSQTSVRRELGTSALHPNTSEQDQQQKQSKLQPQEKSFSDLLDLSSDIMMSSNTSLSSTMTEVQNSNSSGEPITTSTVPSITNATNPTSTIGKSNQESSLNDDLIGILNEITELMVSIAVPLAVVLGIVLIVSILIAICNLCIKKRKSKQFEVGDRFKFRYGSERKGFLKKSSKPVILEADQKSLSMGGTPRHQPLIKGNGKTKNDTGDKKKKASYTTPTDSSGSNFFAMSLLSGPSGGGFGQMGGDGGFSGGESCGMGGDGGFSGGCG
jgi:hypothetical protein